MLTRIPVVVVAGVEHLVLLVLLAQALPAVTVALELPHQLAAHL
jgi:hypothetical protein